MVAMLCRQLNKQTTQFLFLKNFFCTMSEKSALILLAEGNEEMEVVIPTDVLRRVGINVTLAGLSGSGAHECSRKVKLIPDASLEEAAKNGPYDIIILPGGLGGSKAFVQSAAVGALLKEQESSGRAIGAICAAPTSLKAHNIALGKSVTSHPSVEKDMLDGGKYTYVKERVVIDGKLITSQGPGTAFEFAISIVEYLLGKEIAEKATASLLLK